jgi:DNA-binding response OmpR family regulator
VQRSIVVADDDPTILELVTVLLGTAHYNVIATTDAVAAIAMVRTKEPAAVILDVQMPGGGGLSALSKIKADPKTSKVPVMMLTGERDAETVMQAMDGGADDYMLKPFNPDTLLERISRLVSKSENAPAPAVWEL